MFRLACSVGVPFALIAAIIAAAPAESLAQDITTEAKWEIDAHVGIMTPGIDRGSSRPLPAADGFTTVTGATSAAVSSWLFGAGTALFNQATGGRSAISPLDQALQSGISRRRGGINVGFTLARWLSPHLAAEVQGDYAPSGFVINDVTLATLEKTVTSYTDAWSALFDAGLAADGFPSDVAANGEVERGGGHRFVLTVGMKAVVQAKRRFRSYVGAGAGFSSTSIRHISATITGAYQFAANVPTASGIARMPFSEREVVSLRAAVGPHQTFVGTVHGGFEYYRDSRRGVRLDIAVLLSPNQVSTLLDATPAVLVQESGAVIAGPTSPTIQFSSFPASVTRSSLTGPSIRDVETSRADGIQAQVKVSVAYFLRF